MYTIFIDYILEENISIEKYGINIRPLSELEKNKLFSIVEEVLKYKKDINKLVKKYNFNESRLDEIFELTKLDKSENNSNILFGYKLLKSGFVYNTKKQIGTIINHFVVIDIDKSVLLKYIDADYISKFISNLLNLNNIYCDPLLKRGRYKYYNYSYILDENDIIDDSQNDYYQVIMMNIIFSYKEKNIQNKKFILKQVNLTREYLCQLKNLINSFDESDAIRFVEIIDLLFNNSDMMQNKIINNVLIVESLLIKENANIQKEYVLKGGMILKKYLESSSIKSNEAVSLLLNFVYDIRSDIVHGNLKKVEADLNKINQKNSSIKKLQGDISNFKNKKDHAYSIALNISTFVTNCAVKYWFDNLIEISYLKNN